MSHLFELLIKATACRFRHIFLCQRSLLALLLDLRTVPAFLLSGICWCSKNSLTVPAVHLSGNYSVMNLMSLKLPAFQPHDWCRNCAGFNI